MFLTVFVVFAWVLFFIMKYLWLLVRKVTQTLGGFFFTKILLSVYCIVELKWKQY